MRTPHSESKHARLRAKIVQVWRDRGHTEATIAEYLKCVERYPSYCLRLGVEEIGCLTRRSVDRFARAYAHTGVVATVAPHEAAARPSLLPEYDPLLSGEEVAS